MKMSQKLAALIGYLSECVAYDNQGVSEQISQTNKNIWEVRHNPLLSDQDASNVLESAGARTLLENSRIDRDRADLYCGYPIAISSRPKKGLCAEAVFLFRFEFQKRNAAGVPKLDIRYPTINPSIMTHYVASLGQRSTEIDRLRDDFR
mgnify:CR=1 FL=1